VRITSLLLLLVLIPACYFCEQNNRDAPRVKEGARGEGVEACLESHHGPDRHVLFHGHDCATGNVSYVLCMNISSDVLRCYMLVTVAVAGVLCGHIEGKHYSPPRQRTPLTSTS
jgi:hypothetical protein